MQKILTELILNELNLSISAIFCTLQTFCILLKGHIIFPQTIESWRQKILQKNPPQKSV